MTIQQALQQPGSDMKARFLESFHGSGKVDEPHGRCPIENSEEARNLQSSRYRRSSRLQIVQDHQVRTKILCEEDRLSFSCLKKAQILGRSLTGRVVFQPHWRACHPIPENLRGLGMPKLRNDSRGNEESIVKGRQNLDFPDQEQVTDWRRIQDDLHRLESPRRVSMSL